MQIKFKNLIHNPILDSSKYKNNQHYKISETLTYNFNAPIKNSQAFVLSCFATSIDGKLCYPDKQSGFNIAKDNLHATQEERYADWWILSLARSVSDAVIIGSNSLMIENGEYTATIDIDELKGFRKQLNKPEQLLHVIICRDANKIDWSSQHIIQTTSIPIVIFTLNKPQELPSNIQTTERFNNNLQKQLIVLDNLDITKIIDILYSSGIQTILNESPYYHHELLKERLLDELWINTSGVYIGGNVASLGHINSSFTSSTHPHFSILTLDCLGYNFLYARYKITYEVK
jgi:riboflavin biosynthesis pyrimidine reductase